MAILRHAPGERVQISGLYTCVKHFGEATELTPKWFDKGEQFPPLEADSDAGPLWFVRRCNVGETAKAA